MNTGQVTLESLFQLMSDMRSKLGQISDRLEHVDQRLDRIDQRLDYLEQRFEKLEKRFDRMEDQQMEDRKIIMELWRDREKVTVTFSKTFAFINVFVAGIVSGLVAFFIKQEYS